jgi:hypothetical protein
MRRFARILAAALVLSAGASAQAPQKPNFSGRWVIVSPPEGAGQEQVVVQDDKKLSIQYPSRSADHNRTYQLDGVERREPMPSPGQEIVVMSRAAWDGDRIVITRNDSYQNGMKTQSKEIWSLDAQGRLVIDYSETGPTGPGPSLKVVHVKKS